VPPTNGDDTSALDERVSTGGSCNGCRRTLPSPSCSITARYRRRAGTTGPDRSCRCPIRRAADPPGLAVPFRLAALLGDDLADFARAERLYLEARAQPGAAAREDAIANALIDLCHRTGNGGRLMAEFARYAERHRGRPEGTAAKRRLMELKEDGRGGGGAGDPSGTG
jgi:hypothetical protein